TPPLRPPRQCPPSATATPTASPRSPATETPTPPPTTRLVTFDDLPGEEKPLIGEYPSGVIDWGQTAWYLSGPWGRFTTKSVSFNGPSVMAASFTLPTPRRHTRFEAYNGGTGAASVTLSCPGLPTSQATIAVDQLATLCPGSSG